MYQYPSYQQSRPQQPPQFNQFIGSSMMGNAGGGGGMQQQQPMPMQPSYGAPQGMGGQQAPQPPRQYSGYVRPPYNAGMMHPLLNQYRPGGGFQRPGGQMPAPAPYQPQYQRPPFQKKRRPTYFGSGQHEFGDVMPYGGKY